VRTGTSIYIKSGPIQSIFTEANGGAHGVDCVWIAQFEAYLSNNLYKIWNLMSSGSYFPPPVRRVEIPKDGGKKRSLGIPT
jgi:retron-type reverse transcriptase